MAELGSVAWPPEPIATERLVLREAQASDRAALIALYASPLVYAHLGGPRPREELERLLPEVPGGHPGSFVVQLDAHLIGTVVLSRREAGRPGRVRPDGGDVELSYLFLPRAWGRGYAAEACRGALDWLADALPGEPVVVCTQSANDSSVRLAARLGFVEAERFEEFGAEQWFGVRGLRHTRHGSHVRDLGEERAAAEQGQ